MLGPCAGVLPLWAASRGRLVSRGNTQRKVVSRDVSGEKGLVSGTPERCWAHPTSPEAAWSRPTVRTGREGEAGTW